jgi:hypothetical protein
MRHRHARRNSVAVAMQAARDDEREPAAEGECRAREARDLVRDDPGVVDELRERTEGMEVTARTGLFGTNALAMYGIDSAAS